MAALGGKIYAIGGWATSGGSILKTGEVYDPSTNQWFPIADMSTQRASFEVVALGGKIYAIGGRATSGGIAMPSGEVYDPLLNQWSPIGEMNVARIYFGCGVCGGKNICYGRGAGQQLEYMAQNV